MSHIVLIVLLIGLTAAIPSPDPKPQPSSKSSGRNGGSKFKEDLVSPFCSSLEFTCDNGNCIPANWECDNENDCKDNSDERHCNLKTDNCATEEFQCNDGTCIPDSWKCDDVNDCDSGEDESNCTTRSHNCNNGDDSSCTDDNTANGIVDVHIHLPRGSCFPPKAVVNTLNGSVTMENLKVGTMVLAVNKQGQLTYSPVITFLDKDTNLESKHTTIETKDGTVLTLTRSHLIYRASHDNHTMFQTPDGILPVFASKIKVNDYIFTLSKEHNQVRPSKVVKVTNMKIKGNYAPLTLEGTIVVDGVLASCYAVIDDHRMAHSSFAPLRLLYRSMPSLLSEKMGETLLSWYPKLLETVGSMVLDESRYHHSSVKHVVREG